MKKTRTQTNQLYQKAITEARKHSPDAVISVMRKLCLNDLFFLLTRVLGRIDADRDWLFERCREFQRLPNDRLDLWAREHYKSTIITFAGTIREVLRDPEITCCIFSHTKTIARGFLRQIKAEFEGNDALKALFPEIVWQDPKRDAPANGAQWSEEKGITLKRKSNPKEATIEAWGLVDGQPTSRHYKLLIYDDIVTRESVTSPEMILKTTDSLALSYNLGADGGRRRFIGTRYHQNDTYATLLKRKTVVPRIYPATHDGTFEGNPVLMSADQLKEKMRDMGTYIYSCQMLQKPTADASQGFDEAWLRYYGHMTDSAISQMNIYILVDPANEKRKHNDYTCMWVVGLNIDNNYYLLDGVRDRLNLTERTSWLFRLHAKWYPLTVGYEHYGMQADVQHIRYVQREKNYHFKITELGGQMPKNDRIRRLVPLFQDGRWYFPQHMMRRTHDGQEVDLIESLKTEELLTFPVCSHDDMLDCLARIEEPDLKAVFPINPAKMPTARGMGRKVKRELTR
jgi:phage terminase large subunit-like protein